MGPAPAAASAIDPVEIYAAAIDTSDYVSAVAPLIRRHVPEPGDLLDVGAGGGQLGRAMLAQGCAWTAIEPNPNMRARLARFDAPPRVLPCGWEAAAVRDGEHDTLLAANIAAPLQQPQAFLARCRRWTKRTVIWVVPAQHGPHGLCFAGCLPAIWHGEDETPGVDIVLRGLAPSERPSAIEFADWTFSGVISNLEEIAGYLADRLGWPAADRRRPQMLAHLAAQAKPDARGWRLDIPRRSAVLFWRV